MSIEDEVIAWAAGKPVLLVAVAWQCAVFADQTIWGLNGFIEGRFNWIMPAAPSARAMLRMYRSHRKWFSVMLNQFGQAGEHTAKPYGDDLVAAGDALRAAMRLPKEQLKAAVETMVREPDFQKVYADTISAVNHEIAEAKAEIAQELAGKPAKDTATVEDMRRPEMQFLMRVWFPCVVAYGEFPVELLKRARHGDDDSAIKLLRIDKSILADPWIADRLHKAHCRGDGGLLADYAVALKGKGKKVKARKMKLRLIGLVSKTAQRMKFELTVPEIEALFNAVHRAKRKGLRDTDFPDNAETVARESRKERDSWGFLGDVPGQK